MGKIKVNQEESVAPTSERAERWEKHLESYKKQNPVKFAEKEARGEFKKIPDSFK